MATSAREGDWQCPNPDCINHQQFPNMFIYGTKVNCPKCGTGKTAKRAGDWCCPNSQCVNHTNTVYGSKNQCQRCGMPKPVPGVKGVVVVQQPAPVSVPVQQHSGGGGGGGPVMRQGDWHCPNASCKNSSGGNFVYGSKSVCGVCGSTKPAGVQAMPAAPTTQAVQYQPQYQPVQYQPVQYAQVPQQMQVPQYAPLQFQQPQYAQVYQVQQPIPQQPAYSMQRPSSNAPRGINGLRGPQPGDWHCPNSACKNFTGNVVFASKTHCPLCGTQKPGGLEAPPPRRQEGDWLCPTPGCKNSTNYVYASKPSCPLCGAANPNAGYDGRGRSRSPRHG